MASSESIPEEPWLAAASERLGQDVASVRRITRARRGRMRATLANLTRPERGVELDPEIVALLQMVRLDPGEESRPAREVARIIDRGTAAGLPPGTLPQVIQAYVRGIGRIVTVEAAVALTALRDTEPERRPQAIMDMLDELLPTGLRGFDLLHRTMLQDALLEGSAGLDADEPELERLAIGMVDLVRSTDYLTSASVEELEHLVDAIFAAGQAATVTRPAHVVKYVGDGLFLASTDVASVADAALEIVAELERELPLRARGGVSFGRVVQRAGDVFGLAVNLSQALTKAARPGTVLLSETAALELPGERRGRLRPRRLPHAALGEQTVATLRATGD